MSDDWEFDDFRCPRCGYEPTGWYRCRNMRCDDGIVTIGTLMEEDPLWYQPGDPDEICDECHGTGIVRFCPGCGAELRWEELKDQVEADDVYE